LLRLLLLLSPLDRLLPDCLLLCVWLESRPGLLRLESLLREFEKLPLLDA